MPRYYIIRIRKHVFTDGIHDLSQVELQLRAARMRRMEVLANGPLRGQSGGHSEHDSVAPCESTSPIITEGQTPGIKVK